MVMVVALPVVATAHEERPVTEPEVSLFPALRGGGPSVVVCKPDSAERLASLPSAVRVRNEALLDRCQFEHIQAAVTFVSEEGEPGTRILVMPGIYREEPSMRMRDEFNGAPVGREDLADLCADVVADATNEAGQIVLPYEGQVQCPHVQNLIEIAGDTTPDNDSIACDGNLCDLQLEGTGARPNDVVLDGDFKIFNGIKAERADGLYLYNFAAQQFEFNAVYILETGGATIDAVDGSFNHEYGFLSFVSYVRYQNCTGQGNGDSTTYPGASPDDLRNSGLIPLHRDEMQFATEIRGCRGHHSALGYSGTTGNSIWAHNNEFDHNSTGLTTDSLFPGHPGTPQNHGLWENNLFHENNQNYYTRYAIPGTCALPIPDRDYADGVVCPAIPVPVGVGLLIAGGNFNWINQNNFYDNWRTGTYQFWVPAELREEAPVPDAHFRMECGPDGDEMCPFEETSHWNTYSGNRLAEQVPFGFTQPNGVDFSWDLEGEANCWAQTGDDANTSATGTVTFGAFESNNPTSTPIPFPDCDNRDTSYSPVTTLATAASCITYNQASDPNPPLCSFMEDPSPPAGREPAVATMQRVAGADRIETAIAAAQEGYPTSAPSVTLARSDLYPDALSGAALARARGGPLLLTGGAGLDPRVAAEIARLGAGQVILLGGANALSTQLETDLAAAGITDVTRVGGADRYATSAKIAMQLTATNAFVAKGDDENGQGWPDALAASPVSALLGRPILLTDPTGLSPATEDLLARGFFDAVDIVGGELAVSAGVQTAIEALVGDVERIAGADRLQTSLELAKWAIRIQADPTELWLTTADNWPDGIAAGSAIAADEGVMLLVNGDIDGSTIADYLETYNPLSDSDSANVLDLLERVRILGGPEAVPLTADSALATAYGMVEGDAQGDRSTGTRTTTGRFHPLAGSDAAYANASGYALMDRRLDGATRVRVVLEGLPTADGTAHPVHVHAEPCSFTPSADNPHFTFDPAGDAIEPNEIHPQVTTGDGATGLGDTMVFEIPEDESLSVMVHSPMADGAVKQLCADLT